MAIPKIEIKQEGTLTKVFMDGEQIHGVRGIHYENMGATERPILRLDIIAADMTLDCPVIPNLPDIYKPFYEMKKEMQEEIEHEIERRRGNED